METRSSEVVSSNRKESQESLEKTKVSTHKEDIPSTNVSSDQAKDLLETLTKEGEGGPMFTPDKSTTNAVGKRPSNEIDRPVQFITPLRFTRGNQNVEVVFIEDLMTILVEVFSPSNFLFSKKKKVVVKREMHQKEVSAIKRHIVLIDGESFEEVEFIEEIEGSLGDFATANQFSVENLKE